MSVVYRYNGKPKVANLENKMSSSKNVKVDVFLHDIHSVSPEQFEILVSIRKIFNDTNPKLVEAIKYGGLVFSLSNTLIGGIYVYEKHLSIEFSNGASLSDPDNILEGKGKKRRHIKIHLFQDIEEKKVHYFVHHALNE